MTERKRNKFSKYDSVEVMEEKIKERLAKKGRFMGHGITDAEAGYLLFSLNVINSIRKVGFDFV